MRIDKYLKATRLIKRRTVAAEACDKGRIEVNGREAKPSTAVKPGDQIKINFGTKALTVCVLATPEHVKAENASSLYEIKGEE